MRVLHLPMEEIKEAHKNLHFTLILVAFATRIFYLKSNYTKRTVQQGQHIYFFFNLEIKYHSDNSNDSALVLEL